MTKLEKLIRLVEYSVNQCYEHDMPLVEKKMEQACVAKIFYYMQAEININSDYAEFRELSLDLEYNKHGEDIKRTSSKPKGSRPDIVLHQRENDFENILVLEFKCRNRTISKNIDFNKLRNFTSRQQLNYTLGIYIYLHKKSAQYTFFQRGQRVNEQEFCHD